MGPTPTLTPAEATTSALRLAHLLATGSTEQRTRDRLLHGAYGVFGADGLLDVTVAAIRMVGELADADELLQRVEDVERTEDSRTPWRSRRRGRP